MSESATARIRSDADPVERAYPAPVTRWRPSRVTAASDVVVLVLVLGGVQAVRGMPLTIWHAVFAVAAVLGMAGRGAYSRRLENSVVVALFRHVGLSVLVAIMATVTLRAIIDGEATSTRGIVLVAACSVVALATSRGLSVRIDRRRRRSGADTIRTLIVGSDPAARKIAERLRRRDEIGLRPVGYLSHHHNGAAATLVDDGVALPVLGSAEDLDAVVDRHRIDAVIVAALEDATPGADWTSRIVERLHERRLTVFVLPRLHEVINTRTERHRLGTMSIDELRPVDPRSRAFHAKYGLDRVVGALATVALLPLLVSIAILIKVTSPGPVLFRQCRVGLDGRRFYILKFRSMRVPEEATGLAAVDWSPPSGVAPGGVEGDDRRTRVGKFLRSTNLDELPQVINIAKGDMCIVGPRPERPEFVELFREEFKAYDARHRVKAGLTGWSQVNGLRGKTSIAERAEWDNYYIENWSFSFDFAIIIQTFKTFLDPNE